MRKGSSLVNSAVNGSEQDESDEAATNSISQLSLTKAQIQKLMTLISEQDDTARTKENHSDKPSLVNSALAGSSYMDSDWACYSHCWTLYHTKTVECTVPEVDLCS
ncbi:PREDICTED: uncharacterized protein LOC108663360 [Theobroma cacao]|uniref:Uncharacterized protein LOC108663360 n=1 Tax=Theobroma cacao TaxID=3641 RepID=A0AB32WTX0_THECC|nr:PREDICTED: uncharacterized protein LOC108663360 [Theobroma cacao]